MQTIGLIVNGSKPRAAEALWQVAGHARALGLILVAAPETIAMAGGGPPWREGAVGDFSRTVEAVVALGGDGTLLKAAHAIQGSGLPLMGLNIGSLGYLTSVEEARFDEALRVLREDRYLLSPRATLAARVVRANGAVEEVPLHALNDVVISRGISARLARIELKLDGMSVTTYACDGLIVATPTGSTAYSLSTGGPIVMPGTPALAICMICPHALGARPLVVPESTFISIHVAGAGAPLLLAVDGIDDIRLKVGDRVEVAASGVPARLAFLPEHDPYSVMSRKLGWGGRGRN